MSAFESTLQLYLGQLYLGRRVLCSLVALALATVTSGCLVDADDEGELFAMTDAAWIDDGGDLEIIVGAGLDEANVDEQGGLYNPAADTEERSGNPEPQPWDDAQSSDNGEDEEGNPEPQPWHRDGETDNPEPQPWHTKVAGELDQDELDDAQADEPSAPTGEYLDDDEPDPNPWMVAAR